MLEVLQGISHQGLQRLQDVQCKIFDAGEFRAGLGFRRFRM